MSSFEAKLEYLGSMLAWVQQKIQAASFPSHESRKIELALEEVLVNIIHHAYGEAVQGNIELSCRLIPAKRIEFTVRDQGIPFNPLLHTEIADNAAPLEERKEGKLGIFFVRQFMDEISYKREGPSNILTLIKRNP